MRNLIDALRVVSSVQKHCFIYKAKDNKWYMELADREYGEKHDAATYGPFSSEEAVHRYLDRVPNPGGYSLDDSGKSPAPTRSPDGSPVVRP